MWSYHLLLRIFRIERSENVEKDRQIVTAVGVVTALLAGCCLDSQDVYGYLAGAVCIIGGFLGGAGYAIYMLAERRRTEVVIEMDKPDIVWIEIEEVGK